MENIIPFQHTSCPANGSTINNDIFSNENVRISDCKSGYDRKGKRINKDKNQSTDQATNGSCEHVRVLQKADVMSKVGFLY